MTQTTKRCGSCEYYMPRRETGYYGLYGSTRMDKPLDIPPGHGLCYGSRPPKMVSPRQRACEKYLPMWE